MIYNKTVRFLKMAVTPLKARDLAVIFGVKRCKIDVIKAELKEERL